jgi:2-keto-4-pentenoate hydratase/2-oxohepta-3-ene-1,7-dioic acid hydratase in catechol pathway
MQLVSGSAAPQGEPASFIKGDHTIIGPGEAIELPHQSDRVTAEAELGLIFGAVGRNVPIDSALSYVWGACTVLDQTAEDILQVNPRYLTRAKNFPGFFSFGPGIVPLDEILDADGTLDSIEVATILNGEVVVSNSVRNMLFSPRLLVSFHSAVMPWYPGDILSTGTPGAVKLSPGDVVSATVTGLPTLTNPVIAGS